MNNFFADGLLTKVFSNFNKRKPTIEDATTFRLDKVSCEGLYHSSRIIQKATNERPYNAVMKSPIVQFGDKGFNPSDVASELKNQKVLTAFRDAGQYGLLYNDGHIILGINDGRDYWEPVDTNKIQSIDWLDVKSGHYLYQTGTNLDYYQLATDSTRAIPNREGDKKITNIIIHKDRILRIPGVRLPSEMLSSNGYHNDSIIQAMFTEFTNYIGSCAMGASMLKSHSIFKYKLQDLVQLTVQQDKQALIDRFESILMGLDSLGGLIMDADREDAEFVHRNYSGVDTLLTHLQEVLIAASDMPRSKLLGSSNSSAFSEGGLSDRYEWANKIDSYQRNYFLSELERYLTYLFLSKTGPTRGVLPDSWEVSFPTILQLTEKEKSELMRIDADTFQKHLEMGTLTQQEIRMACWGGSTYSNQITLMDGTKDSLLINGVGR